MSLTVNASNYDFYPALTADKAPTLIFVHGGAWISGSKAQYKPLAQALASRGYCVAVAGYGLAPKVKHPGPVDELNTVITDVSLKKNNKCESKRIFLVGHSAGAHMIAFWNTKYLNPAVKGFVGVEGIYDLEKLAIIWPGYKDWFMTLAFGDEKKWAAASPAKFPVNAKSPWLLVHSAADELVDFAQTKDFQKHLESQKVSAKLVALKTENHFGAIESLNNKNSALSQALMQFTK